MEEIVSALKDVSTASVEEPRNLESGSRLRNMLEEVAATSGPEGIALHGRLLAKWLHFAFPHDCTFPQKSGTTNPKALSEWQETGSEKVDVKKLNDLIKFDIMNTEAIIEKMKDLEDEEIIIEEPAPIARASAWKVNQEEEEVLTHVVRQTGTRSSFRGGCLIAGLIVACVVGAAKIAGAGPFAKEGLPTKTHSNFGMNRDFGVPMRSWEEPQASTTYTTALRGVESLTNTLKRRPATSSSPYQAGFDCCI